MPDFQLAGARTKPQIKERTASELGPGGIGGEDDTIVAIMAYVYEVALMDG